MTRDDSHLDRAQGDSAFDFIACLASRWGIDKQAAQEMLGHWMAVYEPAKARAPKRPSVSGVFPRPSIEDADQAEKAGAA